MSDYREQLEKFRLKTGWMSNSPTFMKTGYADQTGRFVEKLKKPDQDNIIILAFRGIEGSAWRNPKGILELPRARDAYMNDSILSHTKVWGLQLIFTLI